MTCSILEIQNGRKGRTEGQIDSLHWFTPQIPKMRRFLGEVEARNLALNLDLAHELQDPKYLGHCPLPSRHISKRWTRVMQESQGVAQSTTQ